MVYVSYWCHWCNPTIYVHGTDLVTFLEESDDAIPMTTDNVMTASWKTFVLNCCPPKCAAIHVYDLSYDWGERSCII